MGKFSEQDKVSAKLATRCTLIEASIHHYMCFVLVNSLKEVDNEVFWEQSSAVS